MRNLTHGYRFRGSSAFLLVCIVGGLLLVGCSSVEERQARALQMFGDTVGTATGAIAETTTQMEEAAQTGWNLIGAVKAGIEDIKRRVNAVQQGIEKIQEGKELIEEGLGTDDESN